MARPGITFKKRKLKPKPKPRQLDAPEGLASASDRERWQKYWKNYSRDKNGWRKVVIQMQALESHWRAYKHANRIEEGQRHYS